MIYAFHSMMKIFEGSICKHSCVHNAMSLCSMCFFPIGIWVPSWCLETRVGCGGSDDFKYSAGLQYVAVRETKFGAEVCAVTQ